MSTFDTLSNNSFISQEGDRKENPEERNRFGYMYKSVKCCKKGWIWNQVK
jgi:hypothetical protein